MQSNSTRNHESVIYSNHNDENYYDDYDDNDDDDDCDGDDGDDDMRRERVRVFARVFLRDLYYANTQQYSAILNDTEQYSTIINNAQNNI